MNLQTIYHLNELKGKKVQDAIGHEYGTVDQILIDAEKARAVYLVVGRGGVLGLGKDYLLIPMHSVAVNPNTKIMKVNLEKEKISAAPGFDKDEIDNMDGEAYEKLNHYFGIKGNSENADERTGYEGDRHEKYEGSQQMDSNDGNPADDMDLDKIRGKSDN